MRLLLLGCLVAGVAATQLPAASPSACAQVSSSAAAALATAPAGESGSLDAVLSKKLADIRSNAYGRRPTRLRLPTVRPPGPVAGPRPAGGDLPLRQMADWSVSHNHPLTGHAADLVRRVVPQTPPAVLPRARRQHLGGAVESLRQGQEPRLRRRVRLPG